MRTVPMLAATLCLLSPATAQKHPFFDDGGALQWQTSFDKAKAAAKQADKLIFVEYGRAACGNCRALAERVLSAEPIKTRIGQMAIGLAIDCDAKTGELGDLWAHNLPDARALPFVAVLTHEGTWVGGYSGYRQPNEVTAFLDQIAKSPLLSATPEVREQLAKLVVKAKAAADKGAWSDVRKAVRAGEELFGRCQERDALTAEGKRMHSWLQGEYDAVVHDAVTGARLSDASKRLSQVARAFQGDPEADIANRGMQAIKRLNLLRSIEARGKGKPGLRDEYAAEFKDTPWFAMFGAAPADDTKAEEPTKEPAKEPGSDPANEPAGGDGKS